MSREELLRKIRAGQRDEEVYQAIKEDIYRLPRWVLCIFNILRQEMSPEEYRRFDDWFCFQERPQDMRIVLLIRKEKENVDAGWIEKREAEIRKRKEELKRELEALKK